MLRNDHPIRMTALALAVAFVAGSMYLLGSYSNEKFNLAVIAAAGHPSTPVATEVAISPSRIEVVGVRTLRTVAQPVATTAQPSS